MDFNFKYTYIKTDNLCLHIKLDILNIKLFLFGIIFKK